MRDCCRYRQGPIGNDAGGGLFHITRTSCYLVRGQGGTGAPRQSVTRSSVRTPLSHIGIPYCTSMRVVTASDVTMKSSPSKMVDQKSKDANNRPHASSCGAVRNGESMMEIDRCLPRHVFRGIPIPRHCLAKPIGMICSKEGTVDSMDYMSNPTSRAGKGAIST